MLENRKNYIVVGLGELLWDILPTGEQLGGAPANFAYITAMLGDCGIVASRIGCDERGDKAVALLHKAGLKTSQLQMDEVRPTGTVEVRLGEKGKPAYTITEGVAWDVLQWTADWQELAARADAVCFGSLAQRSPQARQTIQGFLQATRPDALLVFDVNLRAPYYSAEVVRESLKLAKLLKLNDEELPILMRLCGLEGATEEESLRCLLQTYDLHMVCLTRGEQGSLLVTPDESVAHPGLTIKVADTIGAGDAFTAALIHHYLRRASLQRISEAANRMGAWVASQVGAMPLPEPGILEEITGE
jgi:fructokinase